MGASYRWVKPGPKNHCVRVPENVNCMAHARRDFTDAIKAIGKGNQTAIKESVAYKV